MSDDDNKPDGTPAASLDSVQKIGGPASTTWRSYTVMEIDFPDGPVVHIMDDQAERKLEEYEATLLLDRWRRGRAAVH